MGNIVPHKKSCHRAKELAVLFDRIPELVLLTSPEVTELTREYQDLCLEIQLRSWLELTLRQARLEGAEAACKLQQFLPCLLSFTYSVVISS
jgi:hypothetical protein